MSTNTFFIQSGSIFFISGALLPSQSISTSIDDDTPGSPVSGNITTTILSSVFQPETQAVSTLQLDPDDLGSFVLSGSSPSASFYMSSSGKMGFGTKNPKTSFDIKTDDFKIRSRDGSKEFLIDDKGRFKTRKFRKSNEVRVDEGTVDLELTGSELVMSYSPGTFELPLKAQVGDIMGTIRWEDESFAASNLGASATPIQIQGKIVASSPEGVAGQIIFQIAPPEDLSEGPIETLRLGHLNTHITGGLNVSGLITADRLNVTQITSSIVSSSILFSSGSNIFGDASTDTHTFKGNITASGGISASGTITANAFVGDGSGLTNAPSTFSNLTASGNISASGTITANAFVGDGSGLTNAPSTFSNLTASGNISASGQFIIGRTGSFTKIIINSDLSGASESPFLISIPDTNGQNQKLQVNHQGTLRFGALDTLPTAITGGLVYSASSFYMGLP